MYNLESKILSGKHHEGEISGRDATVSSDMLESVIESSPQLHRTSENQRNPVHGAVIGTMTGWSDAGQPLVTAEEILDGARPAYSVIATNDLQPGMKVVLQFERGDPSKPLLMGIVQQPAINEASQVQAEVDNERLLLTADREITLKCGKASITLTKAGKILIRGAYVLNRSSGVNRIKGGVVHIN